MGLRIFALGDPSPGDGDGAFTASQTDDQELVSEAIFRSVNDQPDLLNMLGLGLIPLLGSRSIPGTYLNGCLLPKAFEPLCDTGYLGFPGNFIANPAQTDRAALKDTNQEPDEALNLVDTLLQVQFTNWLKPGIINAVDRHR